MPSYQTLKKPLPTLLLLLPALLIGNRPAQSATITYSASLASATEVPPTGTQGLGNGTFTFDTVADTVTYFLSWSNLSASASLAHLHFGPVGVSGPIVVPFSPSPSGTSGSISGVVTASQINFTASPNVTDFADLVNAAAAGDLYSNLHSTNFPGGEIRGQLTAVNAVPEPSSIGLLAVAFAAACVVSRQALRNQIANRLRQHLG